MFPRAVNVFLRRYCECVTRPGGAILVVCPVLGCTDTSLLGVNSIVDTFWAWMLCTSFIISLGYTPKRKIAWPKVLCSFQAFGEYCWQRADPWAATVSGGPVTGGGWAPASGCPGRWAAGALWGALLHTGRSPVRAAVLDSPFWVNHPSLMRISEA